MVGMVFGSGGGGGSLPKLSSPATGADILQGKEAIDSKGQKILGTIQTKGAQTYTPGSAAQVIPAGQYLAGDQTIGAVPTQVKTVAPLLTERIVTPASGKFLSQVTVEGVEVYSEKILLNKVSSVTFTPGFRVQRAVLASEFPYSIICCTYGMGYDSHVYYLDPENGNLAASTNGLDYEVTGTTFTLLTDNPSRYSFSGTYLVLMVGY